MSAAKRKKYGVGSEVNYVYLIILGLLFSYPPFQQGLWFDFDWLPYQAALAICGLGFLVYYKRQSPVVSLEPIDVAVVSFLITYLFSVLVAVDTNSAVQAAMKVAGYLVIFALVTLSLNSIREIKIVLRIFYWTGIAVVFYSMGAAFGTFTYSGALLDGRVYSILEYPNIFAGYTLTILLIGLYLGDIMEKPIWRAVYAFGNYFVLIGFFAAKSRGAFLTMGVVLLIYIIGLGRSRLKISLQLLVFLICSYLFSEKVFNPAVEHAALYYWGILLVVSLPGLLTIFINSVYSNKKIFTNPKIKAAVITIVLIAVAIVGVNLDLLNTRIFDLTANTDNTSERLVFYQDALKIIKTYPLLGAGGGGWESLYRQFQGYGYITTQIHNQYLQVWVEAGTFGLAAFLGIWAAAFFTTVRILKKGQPEIRFLTWTIFCASIVIGIHSFGDFNLSMPAIAILLWGLLGCLRAIPRIERVPGLYADKLTFKLKAKPLLITLAGIFLVISSLQATALNYGDQGLADLQANDFTKARIGLETATRLNPLASYYWSALGESLMYISDAQNDPELLDTALKYVDKAIRLDPYNPNFRLVKGKGLLVADKIVEAVSEFEEANKLAPWDQKFVDRLAETYAAVGHYYYYNKDNAKARVYLEKAVDYPKVVLEKAESMDPKYKALQQRLGPAITVSEKVKTASTDASELLLEI